MGDIAIIKLTIAITVGIVLMILVIAAGMTIEEMHEDYQETTNIMHLGTRNVECAKACKDYPEERVIEDCLKLCIQGHD